jgi:hypothetical protein
VACVVRTARGVWREWGGLRVIAGVGVYKGLLGIGGFGVDSGLLLRTREDAAALVRKRDSRTGWRRFVPRWLAVELRRFAIYHGLPIGFFTFVGAQESWSLDPDLPSKEVDPELHPKKAALLDRINRVRSPVLRAFLSQAVLGFVYNVGPRHVGHPAFGDAVAVPLGYPVLDVWHSRKDSGTPMLGVTVKGIPLSLRLEDIGTGVPTEWGSATLLVGHRLLKRPADKALPAINGLHRLLTWPFRMAWRGAKVAGRATHRAANRISKHEPALPPMASKPE